jgi:hypothetical protein
MKIDFFDKKCLTETNAEKFGIIDGIDDNKAFLIFQDHSDWICTIVNSNAENIEFRSIDNCIIVRRDNNDKERTCDCMLTYADNIVFIELKNKISSWINDGIEQIEQTIIAFKENHDIDVFKHKRAFVANKKHPQFHVIENETMIKFYSQYSVRLNVQAEIVIK